MSNQTQTSENNSRTLPAADQIRFGLFLALLGLLIFLVGAKPEWLGMDRSPVIGFVQIFIFMAGLAVICLGGYVGLGAMWAGEEKSIGADIGLRLVATGYVISVFSGMADVLGMSIKDNPRVPFFGPWQQAGIEIGMITIAVGLLMVVPWQRLRKR